MKTLIHLATAYDIPYNVELSGQNHSHVDLKVHPDEIRNLPELRGRPDLKELVEVMNRGPFMTHGCAFGLGKPHQPEGDVPMSEESKTARHWCSSYVTFSFWEFSRNVADEYQPPYEALTTTARGTEVCFVLQPAYFLTAFERQQGRKYGITNATVW
jgi:hypothetical protein